MVVVTQFNVDIGSAFDLGDSSKDAAHEVDVHSNVAIS